MHLTQSSEGKRSDILFLIRLAELLHWRPAKVSYTYCYDMYVITSHVSATRVIPAF